MKMFIATFINELKRQEKMIYVNQELKKRNAKVSENIVDLTEILKDTECKFIKKNIENKGKVYGFALFGFSGLLGLEFYPGRRFGTEVSDYAKSAHVNGIIHSDEDLKKYQFKDKEIDGIKKELGLKEKDSFIIVSDSDSKARKAIEFAIARAKKQIENGFSF